MVSLLLDTLEVELVKSLNNAGVKYIVIGGHAVQFHGHQRPAKDLDLFVEPSQDNAERLRVALSGLSLPVDLSEAYVKRAAQPNAQLKIADPYYTELLTSIDGITFEKAMASSIVTNEGGVSGPVLSYEDLIATKKALGRSQDLEDINALAAARAGE